MIFCVFDGKWVGLDIQREEKNVQKAIKEAAKRNDMGSAKVLVVFLYIIVEGVNFGFRVVFVFVICVNVWLLQIC